VATLRRRQGGLHARGTSSHHRHAPGGFRALNPVFELPAGTGVEHAGDWLQVEDVVEAALVAPYAVGYLLVPPFGRLDGDLRIGDETASHGH